MLNTFLQNLWQVFLDLSPSLLLGLLLAGMLHAYLPKGLVHKGMSKPNLASSFRASLIGVPMPLCSCGVVPAALALKNEGASKGATTAFLISTPQTGVDSLLVSASMLGWPFAVFKLFASFITGLIGGGLVNRFTRHEPTLPLSSQQEAGFSGSKPKEVVRYAVYELLGAIDLWILAGVVVAALITAFVPADFFSNQAWSAGLLGMLVVLAISLPLYVCTTGSVPIAYSLIAAGMPLGSALVFLMAGPATNVATIGAVYRTLGGRVLSIYLATVIFMSIILGLSFDFVLGPQQQVAMAHEHGTDWIAVLSALLVIGLMIYLSALRIRNRWNERRAIAQASSDLILQVEGMTCQHCVGRVKQTLEGFDVVEEASPSLSSGQVRIRGKGLDAEALIGAVEKAGYQVKR